VSIKVLGGNPILAEASLQATENWRWKQASGTTEEHNSAIRRNLDLHPYTTFQLRSASRFRIVHTRLAEDFTLGLG